MFLVKNNLKIEISEDEYSKFLSTVISNRLFDLDCAIDESAKAIGLEKMIDHLEDKISELKTEIHEEEDRLR